MPSVWEQWWNNLELMINGLMPKLYVITLEGFNMLTVNKSKDYDECQATGESCSYERVEIPSDFIDGQGGGEVTVITQCKYCGKPFEYEDKK